MSDLHEILECVPDQQKSRVKCAREGNSQHAGLIQNICGERTLKFWERQMFPICKMVLRCTLLE